MTLLLWLGVVLLGGGWLFVVPVFQRPDALWAGGVFLAGATAIGLACRRAGAGRGSLLTGVALLAVTAVAHLWVDPLVYLLGSRVHRFDLLAPLVSTLLGLAGYDSHLSDGVVYVAAPSHLLPFTVNAEKLGLLPALWIGASAAATCLFLRRRRPLRTLVVLGLTVGAYLLLRYVTLVALFLDHPDPRNLDVDHSTSLAVFQSPRYQLLSLLPLALVLAAVLPWRRDELGGRPLRAAVRWRGVALWTVAAAALVAALQYQDPGVRKPGRVLFDEFHSAQWESAARPLDTEWYGRQSVYNYASFVDFLRQYYSVDLNVDAAYDDALLADVDVLVIKTTTVPFATEELAAIERFVEAGGGLFLIGDHTDLLGMSTHMNRLAGRFGMRFRLDAANRLDDGHLHAYTPHPLHLHPATAQLEQFEFMTSCTLEAPLDAESVMIGSNTFSDPLDYSAPSFFGNVIPDTEDDFGLHLLSAATRHGAGRVLAFSDSTVFSNFAVLYGEHPEFLLGTLEYLNRRAGSGRHGKRLALGVGCALLLLGGLALRGRGPVGWGVAATAGLGLGVVLGGALTSWHVRAHYPPPQPLHKATTLLFPRGWGDYELPAALGHIHVPLQDCFDTFYVWTQRLGYVPRTLDWEDGLPIADAVVLINPVHAPDEAELAELVAFVKAGGRLLVLDSLWNRDSTANALLEPFGLRVAAASRLDDNLFARPGWLERHAADDSGALDFGGFQARPLPGGVLLPGSTVLGGTSLFRTDDERNLATSIDVGRGRVIAFVDSIAFSRLGMGEQVQELPPDDPRRDLFELQFSLLRDYLLVDDEPAAGGYVHPALAGLPLADAPSGH